MAEPTRWCMGAVEGLMDEAVLIRILLDFGAGLKTTYIANGKPNLLRQLHGYNNAAQHSPWIVLVDLDHSADCPPPMRLAWLPHPAPRMCFRIVRRAIEAWLLADRQAMAGYLGVPISRMPLDPEQLGDPKQTLVNLARRSRRREIREGIVPRAESGRQVGPSYTLQMIEFAAKWWQPGVAEHHADSLRRLRARIVESIGTW